MPEAPCHLIKHAHAYQLKANLFHVSVLQSLALNYVPARLRIARPPTDLEVADGGTRHTKRQVVHPNIDPVSV